MILKITKPRKKQVYLKIKIFLFTLLLYLVSNKIYNISTNYDEINLKGFFSTISYYFTGSNIPVGKSPYFFFKFIQEENSYSWFKIRVKIKDEYENEQEYSLYNNSESTNWNSFEILNPRRSNTYY